MNPEHRCLFLAELIEAMPSRNVNGNYLRLAALECAGMTLLHSKLVTCLEGLLPFATDMDE
jgi:hypothetical protein